MAKTIKKPKRSATFKHQFTVEVSTPEFEPLASLDSLDVSRLSKGSHKIEVGVVKGECCSKLVRAIIRKGMVTSIEVESCKDTEPASPELLRLLKEGRRRLGLDAGTKFKPVPVGELADSAGVILAMFCHTVCFPHLGRCFRCCIDRIPPGGGVGGTITVCSNFPAPTKLP